MTQLTIIYLVSWMILREYCSRAALEDSSHFLEYDDIDIKAFNDLIIDSPYSCKPLELAGHFEYLNTVS